MKQKNIRQINSNFGKIIALALLLLFSINFSYASGGLNVVLASQNPDPVSPGNFVYVNVKVSNSGSSDIRDVNLKFIENENFKIAQGSDIEKSVGVIPAFSTLDSSNNFVIAKFKIFVDSKTPLGLNTLSFEVKDSSTIYGYDFDLLVQDANPSVRISDFKIEKIEPGKSSKLVIDVVNDNSIVLKDLIISLDLNNVEAGAISTFSGSNQKIIGLINPGEIKSVEYDLIANPLATSKPYNIPLIIEYKDALGNSFVSNAIGSIQVYSEPLILVNLDSQESFSKGNSRTSFAISNPGTSSIKGTQVEILDSDNYEIIEGKFQYVGDLNPDDFQTFQSELYVKSDENFNILLKVKYLDSYNNINEDLVEIDYKVFSENQLKEFGLLGNTFSGIGSVISIIVFILLIVGAYIFGRKKGFKKGKSSRKD